MNNTLKFIISIILPQLIGGVGALVTISSVGSWYQTIKKPFFHPAFMGFWSGMDDTLFIDGDCFVFDLEI